MSTTATAGALDPSQVPTVALSKGMEFLSDSVTVTQDMIDRFATFGDTNPIHLDREYALSLGLPETVAHGALVFAIATGQFWSMRLGGKTKTVFRTAELKFVKFVFSGDSVRTKVKVMDVEPKLGITITTLNILVTNQNGETVQKGVWSGITS